MPTNRLRLRAVAAIAVFAILGVACGDDSGGDDSDASATTEQSNAPTGSTIKIGLLATLSGAHSSSSLQGKNVAQAWAAWKNANGGINGHRVEVIAEDDKGDPAAALTAVKKLVESDKIIAMAGGSDNLISAVADYLKAQKVPWVGGPSNQTPWYSNDDLFPLSTDVISGLGAQVAVAKKYGNATKFANTYCAEIAACKGADAPLSAAAKAAGLPYESIAVSSTAPDYKAECLKLKADKVDYVQLNFEAAAALKFVQSCQAQGYNPTFGASMQSLGTQTLEIPDLTLYGPSYTFNPVDGSAVSAAYNEVMDQYAKGNITGGPATWQWDALQVLDKVLSNVTTDPPTSADVISGIYALKGDDLDGQLANPINFTAGKPASYGGNPCYFVMGVKDGEVTAPAGAEKQCPAAAG